MKKVLTALLGLASNIHNVNAGVEKAYNAWATIYQAVLHWLPGQQAAEQSPPLSQPPAVAVAAEQ